MIKISDLTYTPLFCEENIWKFLDYCQTDNTIKPLDVIFIINPDKTVVLFDQKLSPDNEPVIWDYHVILSATYKQQTVIFDFDSRRPFPDPINSYFTRTFPSWSLLPEKLRPLLRIINAAHFYKHFSSDRSHMLGVIADDKFPKYEAISPENHIEPLYLQDCFNIYYESINELSIPETYLRQALSNQSKSD